MALLFLDSFDHYLDGNDKYLASGSNIIVPGRHGKGASSVGRLSLDNVISNRCILGAAFRFGSTFNKVYNISDYGNIPIISIDTTNWGGWTVYMYYQSGPEHIANSPPDVWRVNQWHYVEVDLTIISGVSGPYTHYGCSACKLSIDGATVIDQPLALTTGIGMGPASPYNWNMLDVMGNANGVIDDFYVLDGAGPAPWNAPLGDVEIDVIRPNGLGALTQWTPYGAANNYLAVADQTPDDDATKVIAATAGLADLYALENINTNNGIIGAQLLICSRRTEEGYATLTPLLRHAGVVTPLRPRSSAPTYFYRNRDVFVTMPNGDPLTDANVNALQAGFRRDI